MADELTAKDLLKAGYSVLAKRHNTQEVVFERKATAEIANDSDWHRTRVGYMGYDGIGLFSLNNGVWAVGRGEKCGSYQGNQYDSDIMALEFSPEGKSPEQTKEELTKEIEGSTNFRNSLVFGDINGELLINKNARFWREMIDKLNHEAVSGFTAQEPLYNMDVILFSTLRHPAARSALYKPEFAGFLANTIVEVFQEQK